ncbi:MAG: hypothetical protein CSA62_11745 [Planctomycetota bacterium]|nr:MAG: hypothetical protein CSA62_11745 [Planctomycetota bacterium]
MLSGFLLLASLAASSLAQGREHAPNLSIDLRVPQNVVGFGAPFPLELLRTWRQGLKPEPWQDTALAPLRVRLLERRQSQEGGYLRERLRFRAQAFSLEPLLVPAIEFVARDASGRVFRASTLPLHLRVESSLAGRNEVEAEGLAPLLPKASQPAARWPFYALVAGFLCGLLWYAARIIARWRRTPPSPPLIVAPPREHALGELEGRLRALPARKRLDREADRAFHVEVSELLREIVYLGHGVGTPQETTREWLQGLERAAPFEKALIEQVGQALRACDYIKFAAGRSEEDSRYELRQLAASLLNAAMPAEEEGQ